MKDDRHIIGILNVAFALIFITIVSSTASEAHCDGLDGPVVKAAQAALAAKDLNPALIWIQQGDEAELRRVFDQALKVRSLGPQAAELADRYFFETLVRLHRAGEGAPFTGLKPAGRDLGPAIPAADRALSTGDVAPLRELLLERLQAGLSDRFNETAAAKDFQPDNVEAGRAYVGRYVTFVHYVEGIYGTIVLPTGGHEAERPEGSHDQH